jgi:formamidopyrimidine-DNA glycosylase
MPELPEVETMCRGIAPIVGRRVRCVLVPKCSYRPISIRPAVAFMNKLIGGEVVEHVSRLGKRVLVHVGGHALILQPKMSGLVLLEAPPDPDHNRLYVEFDGQPELRLTYWDRRGLGTIELLPEMDIHQRIVAGRLGPDALEVSGEEFRRRLGGTKRAIKVALLDQKLIAGVGNLYASEMLHVARVHPAQPSDTLSSRKIELLRQAMLDILRTAIEHEGSTLSDGTYRNALNDPGSYQNQHLVYDRAGLPCSTCGKGIIERIVQAQRSTFFCPKCQHRR